MNELIAETANSPVLPDETVSPHPYAEETAMTENSEDYATANLAALNRAKVLAGKWEADVPRLDALAGLKTDPADAAEVRTRAQAFEEAARQLRATLRTDGSTDMSIYDAPHHPECRCATCDPSAFAAPAPDAELLYDGADPMDL